MRKIAKPLAAAGVLGASIAILGIPGTIILAVPILIVTLFYHGFKGVFECVLDLSARLGKKPTDKRR